MEYILNKVNVNIKNIWWSHIANNFFFCQICLKTSRKFPPKDTIFTVRALNKNKSEDVGICGNWLNFCILSGGDSWILFILGTLWYNVNVRGFIKSHANVFIIMLFLQFHSFYQNLFLFTKKRLNIKSFKQVQKEIEF